jgi:hypothetical protein
MTDPRDKRVSQIADAIEHIWLRYEAAQHLLRLANVANYYELIMKYTEEEANKTRARERFAEVRARLQSCLLESEALESLSKALESIGGKS